MTVLTFTTSQSWTVPSGITLIDPIGKGGGGGGAYNTAASRGGGGGGASAASTGVAVTPGEVLTITIGAGGSNPGGANGAGGAGGVTTLKRGATVLLSANGGSGGTAVGGGGAGGTTAGGVGDTLTAGSAGDSAGAGGAGGLAATPTPPAGGDGGNGGDGTIPQLATSGSAGVLQISYAYAGTTTLDSTAYSLSFGSVSFLHQGITQLSSLAYSIALADIAFTHRETSLGTVTVTVGFGAVNFLHQGVTALDPLAYVVATSPIVFGHLTALDSLAYNITLGAINFSTAGGSAPAPPTNIVLPNRAFAVRSLPATWASLRFRQNDNQVTREQKLEILREKTVAITKRSLMFSFTNGLPSANPAEPLVRMELTQAMTLGAVTATAGHAATAPVAFRFKKSGAANGTVTFTGTAGVAAGITDYAAGTLFEIYPPTVADPTLDDVSISIAVTLG